MSTIRQRIFHVPFPISKITASPLVVSNNLNSSPEINDLVARTTITMHAKALPAKIHLRFRTPVKVKDNRRVNARAKATDAATTDRTVEAVRKAVSDRVVMRDSEEAVAIGVVRLRLLLNSLPPS